MYRTHLALLGLLMLFGGCTAADQKPTLMQPVPQSAAFQEPAPRYSNPGSMFDANNTTYLYDDSRARRVGDIVMVKVVENATGSNSANTTTKQNNSSDYTVSSLFGKTSVPVFGGAVGNDPLLAMESNKDFKGQGSTDRKNNVTATVTARVLNVMPDGLLQIEGARETKVNNETQYLVVSGLIRSRDVASDNSILSTQMADAHIEYYGKGVVSDRQKPGWFTRLMDHVWPF